MLYNLLFAAATLVAISAGDQGQQALETNDGRSGYRNAGTYGYGTDYRYAPRAYNYGYDSDYGYDPEYGYVPRAYDNANDNGYTVRGAAGYKANTYGGGQGYDNIDSDFSKYLDEKRGEYYDKGYYLDNCGKYHYHTPTDKGYICYGYGGGGDYNKYQDEWRKEYYEKGYYRDYTGRYHYHSPRAKGRGPKGYYRGPKGKSGKGHYRRYGRGYGNYGYRRGYRHGGKGGKGYGYRRGYASDNAGGYEQEGPLGGNGVNRDEGGDERGDDGHRNYGRGYRQ